MSRKHKQQLEGQQANGSVVHVGKRRRNKIAQRKAELDAQIRKLQREGARDNDHRVMALKAQRSAVR